VTEPFRTLAATAGLPPVSFHGLRHGSASMLLVAGVDLKVFSQTMGHATAAFAADVYVTVLEAIAESAASAIAALIPPVVPAMCQQEARMISETQPATAPIGVVAGQERRLGDLNPGWA